MVLCRQAEHGTSEGCERNVDLNGTYRGFSPTDESGVGLGELEVVITDDAISYRLATGSEIMSDQVPRSLLRELSANQVADLFNAGTDTTGTTAHVLGEDGAIFLFLACRPDIPDDTVRVLLLRFVSEEIDAIFGPSRLFTPDQVAAGYFDQCLSDIEAEQGDPGVIPRLANAGHRR